MIRLLTTNLWDSLTQFTRNTSKAYVATAYVGTGARSLLPLKRGSTLVVDLSENSVKSGTTNPHEILKFIKAGVDVFSVENLHAKVFVFPRRAIIGSSNASHRSADLLVEAALETTEPDAVRAARTFVKSLTGDPIGPEYCKAMIKLYKPPKWSQLPPKPDGQIRKNIWVFPLVIKPMNKTENRESKTGRKTAMTHIEDGAFRLSDFLWPTSGLKLIKIGDRILQSINYEHDKMLLFPGKVIHIRHFDNKGRDEGCVYLELPSSKKRRRLKKSRTAIGNKLASQIRSAEKAFLIRNSKSIKSIEDLWA